MTHLVGLVGYPGVGKDTLADILVTKHGWKKVAFADALKDLFLLCEPHCRGLMAPRPIRTRDDLETAKRMYVDIRESLQRFGHAVRDIDPGFWVRAARQRIHEYSAAGYNVIVSDVRYPNEVHRLRREWGHVFGICRDGHGPVNDHKSELNTGELLKAADGLLINDGSPEKLENSFFDLLDLHR